jgi:hypothetical protein
MGDGRQKQHESFESLYKEAEESVPVLKSRGDEILQNLQDRYGESMNSVRFEMGPLKSAERAMSKIDGDYAGDYSRIGDLVRGRLVVDDVEQVVNIQDFFSQDRDAMGVESLKDKFAAPTPAHYRDINTKMRLPNGHVAEFRVEHQDMISTAEGNHKLYEEMQGIERGSNGRMMTDAEAMRHEELSIAMAESFDATAEKHGLNKVLNEDGLREMDNFKIRKENFLTKFGDSAGKLGRNSGVIGGVVLGAVSGVSTFLGGGSVAEAAEDAYATAVPYGETQIDLAQGDLAAASKSATVETASNFGGLAGAAAGTAIGGTIGSAVPIIGTVIGAGIGGVIGGVGGGLISAEATDRIYDAGNGMLDKVSSFLGFSGEAADSAPAAAQSSIFLGNDRSQAMTSVNEEQNMSEAAPQKNAQTMSSVYRGPKP